MTQTLKYLRETNKNLHKFLRDLSSDHRNTAVAVPEACTTLLAELSRMASFLEHADQNEDPEYVSLVREYHSLLLELREQMPSLHAHLLTERARLEANRRHLEAAACWADGSRHTKG